MSLIIKEKILYIEKIPFHINLDNYKWFLNIFSNLNFVIASKRTNFDFISYNGIIYKLKYDTNWNGVLEPL